MLESKQAAHWIAPDGCRDLIWWQPPGQRPRWKLTALADSAETVRAPLGTQYRGWRLLPGTMIDECHLLNRLTSCDEGRTDDAIAALTDATHIDPHVHETLAILARSLSVRAAVRTAGLGERTLERLTRQATGRTPTYWLALARVRRAAQSLSERDYDLGVRRPGCGLGWDARRDSQAMARAIDKNRNAAARPRPRPDARDGIVDTFSGDGTLAELAHAHGYADQAHMTRAFRRWFGLSPARLRASGDGMSAVRSSGYGDVTPLG
ncbi:AraC family transcriptional regulator [Ottowia testudinis]|uniref:AraC family transcriptional regulator n=2 Tax=Ottowia testudinis TaxID=2816950 RepID=A0A975H7S4_9BURK|nr:AraC family transcriptional regulator [Ottowia testudinis]